MNQPSAHAPDVPIAPDGVVLSVRSLRKRFPGVLALGGVDFDVRSGEVHALLGANGAGKSTLIKIIVGLYHRDDGEILLNGKPVSFPTTADARAAGISVIYQDPALVPDLTVAENIFLGDERTSPLGLLDSRGMKGEAKRLLAMVGANFPESATVARLSPGQRQLVEIAKALRTDAQVLILDEPTASLSHAESQRLFALVRQLAERGVGIVYVSHRLEEIAPLVQRVTVLRDGTSAGTFAAADLDREKIIRLITGKAGQSSRRGRRAPAGEAPMLEVRRMTRKGEFEDVSLTANPGEVLVITGLVGAGRTELLETLFGRRIADQGEMRVMGRPLVARSPGEAVAAGIALIPEDRRGQGLAVSMPLYENVVLPILPRFMTALGLSVGREIAHTARFIAQLNIRPADPRARAGALSGGNQQKAVLAKWLSTDARILLFDEPTQGVDVGAKDEIYAIIDELAAQGRGVVIVSSDLEEVIAVADRVIAMRAGRVVGEFAGDRISANRIVEAITHGTQA